MPFRVLRGLESQLVVSDDMPFMVELDRHLSDAGYRLLGALQGIHNRAQLLTLEETLAYSRGWGSSFQSVLGRGQTLFGMLGPCQVHLTINKDTTLTDIGAMHMLGRPVQKVFLDATARDAQKASVPLTDIVFQLLRADPSMMVYLIGPGTDDEKLAVLRQAPPNQRRGLDPASLVQNSRIQFLPHDAQEVFDVIEGTFQGRATRLKPGNSNVMPQP